MGDILKEAIADAKAVRETALANAKMALEEAFTPQLKSMLSAKLKEDEFEGDEEEVGGEEEEEIPAEEGQYHEDEEDFGDEEEGEPEVSNTVLTVKRNLNNEIQNVINEEDKGCKKT